VADLPQSSRNTPSLAPLNNHPRNGIIPSTSVYNARLAPPAARPRPHLAGAGNILPHALAPQRVLRRSFNPRIARGFTIQQRDAIQSPSRDALHDAVHPRARVHRHRGRRRLRGLVRRASGRDACGGVPESPGYGGVWPGRAGGVCADSEQPGGAAAGGVGYGGYGRRAWEWVDGAQDGAHRRGEGGASRAC